MAKEYIVREEYLSQWSSLIPWYKDYSCCCRQSQLSLRRENDFNNVISRVTMSSFTGIRSICCCCRRRSSCFEDWMQEERLRRIINRLYPMTPTQYYPLGLYCTPNSIAGYAVCLNFKRNMWPAASFFFFFLPVSLNSAFNVTKKKPSFWENTRLCRFDGRI